MRRAGEISALAHTRAMQKCRPGMFEYQLEGGNSSRIYPLMALVIRPTTRLSAAARTPAFCTTPKMSVSCATAI
jgi:hypothetical protein